MSIVKLERVSKQYGRKSAVEDVSFAVASGEVLCLLGPNGAGKTTTLKMILGLEVPSTGTIEIAGINVVEQPREARRCMAYIPEMVALHENFSGLENLRYFAALVGNRDHSRQDLQHCLVRAGLQEEAWHQRLSGYSKGMRQKVCVAIALAKRAELLVLDEPTSGLDPKSAFDFAELVQDIAASGAGVIIATHDLFRAKDMGTQILILNNGRIVRKIDPATHSYEDIENAYLGVFEGAA